MPLRLAIFPLALTIPVVAGAAAANAADAMAGLSRPVASCVLQHLPYAYGDAAVDLVVSSCIALVEGNPADGSANDFLVRCRVAGDPEWIEFRLVTRGQCAAANGRIEASR